MAIIPKGWALVKLGDVTRLRKSKIDPNDFPPIPFIGLEDVEAHTGELLNIKSTLGLKSAVTLFEKNDLLYCKLRPYLNKVLVSSIKGAASAEFLIFQPTPLIEQRYLQLTLMTKEFVDFTGLISSGDRPRVTYEGISKFSFPIPPLEEQKRILSIVDLVLEKTKRQTNFYQLYRILLKSINKRFLILHLMAI